MDHDAKGAGPNFLTKSAYAKRRDVSPSLVTYWHQTGRIKLTEDGRMVDVDASDRMLATSLAPDRGGRNAVTRDRTPAAEASTGDRAHYGRVRTARESIRVKHDHIRYQREVGELVELARVHKANADALGPIIAAIDSLPARIMQHIPVAVAHTVQGVLNAEIVEMRRDITHALRTMAASAAGETRH